MIVQLRLDERLIHGQITTAWSKALDINTILCADDFAAVNPVAKQALLMAQPAGIKVAIRKVEDAIRLLKDPRADKMKIFLLVGNPHDALIIVEQLGIKEVNVANYMRKKTDNKVKIATYCQADSEDLVYFKDLAKKCRVYSQMVPSSEVLELNDKLKNI